MEWISVKDRLPEEGEHVLTYNKDDGFKIDYIIKFDQPYPFEYIWACILIDDHLKVSHWCELPKPPGEK